MAAPPLKLKQSLLDSFLSRKSPNHDCVVACADPITPTSHGVLHPSPSITSVSTTDAAAEYERVRQENIRRNRDFLQKLGIPAGPFGPKTASPPQPKFGPKRRQPGHSSLEARPLSVLPVRRSTRKRPLRTPSPDTAQEDAGGDSLEPLAPTYVDSSVFQYACEDAPEDVSSHASSSSSPPISGFKVTGRSLRDPSLAKIYAADVCRARDEKVLVAAGGHGGFISIFGVDLAEDEEEGGCDGRLERGVEEPLLSWNGSKSWVSGVLFAEDNPVLLISSSNDGAVVVWDVSKQQSSLASSSVSPPVVAESKGMHSGGIFSMHRKGCSIATASKDSSVGLHMLKMDGQLVAERTISGHHRGVIRGICFGGTKHILADCGADGSICVLDARLPEPCTLTIESNHLSPINTVEWCPSNSFLLLSASRDPVLRLYDIRNPRKSIHELQGHVQTNARICKQIYRPTFVDNGAMVVTPGPASKRISMFSLEKQKLMSQGSMGYDANLVLFTGECTAQPRLWTAGKQMNQLRALRLEASL